ncbi:MAG: DUF1289 domain-containing protein [Geminicoccaceae bacterium]
MSLAAESRLASPCVGICRLDPDTGWCLGCARDARELALWRDLAPAAQERIWDDLPRRKAVLGLAFRLLPLAGEALLDHLAGLARTPGTRWRIGVPGAGADLGARAGETPACALGEGGLLVRVAGGVLRLRPPAGARLFELVGAAGRVEQLVLALHQARLRAPPAASVTELGRDAEAVAPEDRAASLFDLGVTAAASRFCVRTGAPALLAALRRAEGCPALDPASGLVPALLAHAPDRVVLSPMGRIEVTGPIARPEGHGGPRTRLLPHLLVPEPAPGPELPPGYVACASIHPDPDLRPAVVR